MYQIIHVCSLRAAQLKVITKGCSVYIQWSTSYSTVHKGHHFLHRYMSGLPFLSNIDGFWPGGTVSSYEIW